ncbi:alpha/beta fold hydrolase [Bdellovibrio bacteriovorus]|uniref:alpha/beta fold hydrolase n=1 Tax=Bdellovibrio bacteriovorus TaxID=959 RepID=UPI003D042507
MKIMNTVVFALILAAGMASRLEAQAQVSLNIPSESTYESGKSLCQKTYASLIAHEKGFYVRVPVDYSRPERGMTEVYSYFHRGFDPSKETMIYFTGGPGQTSHWGLFRNPVPYNVLIMEHRGVGCSRPDTRSMFLDPSYYSSENVARDAEVVRQHLMINQWTVYGISYGTVPATMYASLFPQNTRAAILEGVVYDGGLQLWDAPHRRKLLQRMLNSLSPSLMARLESVSAVHGIPDTWLSRQARTQLMYNDGVKKLKERLELLTDDKVFKDFLTEVRKSYEPITYTPHILFASNDIAYMMISCQELGMATPEISIEDSFIKGQLVRKVDTESLKQCARLRAKGDKIYRAENYPVKVPVTYFQGSDDGATAAPEGVRHYKNVPVGFKQLAILVRGGHNPNLELILYENPQQLQIFDYAMKGLPIPKSLYSEMKKNTGHFWAYTSN